jgi:hypothetical protein
MASTAKKHPSTSGPAGKAKKKRRSNKPATADQPLSRPKNPKVLK